MKKNNNSKYNIRRELVKLECRDCGADLEITDDIYAHCKFCGQKYIVNELLERIPEASVQKKPQPVTPQTIKPLLDEQQKKKVIITIMFTIILSVVSTLIVAFMQIGARDSSGDRNSLWDGDIIMVGNQDKDEDEDDRTEKWDGFRSQTMQQVVYHMFGKPAEEVTQRELKSIKYLKIESDWDNYIISYSTEDYQTYEPDYREKLPDYNGHILFGYNQEFEKTIQKLIIPYYEESSELIYGDIRNFKNLTAISLDRCRDMDFSYFPHLTMLDGGGDLNYLLETNLPLDQIEVLSLSHTNLEGLEQFTSLKKLFIEGIDEEEIEHVVKCTNLDTLFCNYCFVEASYAPLKALTGLKTLYVDGGYEIKDLSVISNFTELENLSITCTDILNIGFVKDLKNLKTFRLSENSQLSNLEGLGTLENLEFLELNINSLYGEDPECQEIGNLKNLKSLALHTVYELDFLYELDQLEELEVRLTFYNDVLQPIAQMKNLKELTLAQTETWHLDDKYFALLQELPQLKKLTIDREEFDEEVDELFVVEGLEELCITNCSFEVAPTRISVGDNLKVLDLSGTFFGDNYNGTLEDDQEVLKLYCEAAPTLEKLNLNFYAVTDLSVLNKLTNLKELSLRYCELTEIPETTFEGCESLEILDISQNQIADISFVKNLPALKDLMIREGYVTDLSPLLDCPKLRYVDVRENPIAENPLTNVVVITQ